MAISTNTFTINAGYAQSDLVLQLESSFAWLGWHDKCDHTGIVTGLTAMRGQYQQDPLVNTGYYYDGEQYTSSGVGTDASFYMTRSGGWPNYVYINRAGYGYTNGEFLQFLPGEVTHGSGTLGWGCTVYVDNSVSYGTSTATFYDKHLESGSTYNYGVLRHKIQDNKKYGVTNRVFRTSSTTSIQFASAPYFYPKQPDGPHTNTTPPYWHNNTTSGPYYYPRLAGDYYLDCQGTSTSQELCPLDNNFLSQASLTVANSNSYQLDLNVYRSGIDPKFVVFSYKQPTLSSTTIENNTFGTFILHNFTTDLWDLDHVWLGGMTTIRPEQTNDAYNPKLEFKFCCSGQNYPWGTKRCAEAPWDRHSDGVVTDYVSMVPSGANGNYIYDHDHRIYSRDADFDVNQNTSGSVKSVNSAADYQAVIKGLPISSQILPCPYYMPDDFVIIDFDYATPSANLQQGDTITISGTEVYTIITGNYTQSVRTRGLLFCARTT